MIVLMNVLLRTDERPVLDVAEIHVRERDHDVVDERIEHHRKQDQE
jgi:hypothetical protein